MAFQQEGLLIRPCPESSAPLRTFFGAEENRTVLGLIKVGQRWPWVRTVLQRRNLLERLCLLSGGLARSVDCPRC